MTTKRRSPQKMQSLELVTIPDSLLNMRTAAAVAGVSEPTMYRLAATDPAFPKLIRLGTRCTRIRAGDLTAWIAAKAKAE